VPTNTRTTALLSLALIAVALAIWTALPLSASKTNDLGYFSACPFAPWSTLALLLVAGVLWAIRQYVLTRAKS
jgi:hypothetical protein